MQAFAGRDAGHLQELQAGEARDEGVGNRARGGHRQAAEAVRPDAVEDERGRVAGGAHGVELLLEGARAALDEREPGASLDGAAGVADEGRLPGQRRLEPRRAGGGRGEVLGARMRPGGHTALRAERLEVLVRADQVRVVGRQLRLVRVALRRDPLAAGEALGIAEREVALRDQGDAARAREGDVEERVAAVPVVDDHHVALADPLHGQVVRERGVQVRRRRLPHRERRPGQVEGVVDELGVARVGDVEDVDVRRLLDVHQPDVRPPVGRVDPGEHAVGLARLRLGGALGPGVVAGVGREQPGRAGVR